MMLRPRLHRFEPTTVRTRATPGRPRTGARQDPGPPPPPPPEEPDGPTLLGFPAQIEDAGDDGRDADVVRLPGSTVRLVLEPRADPVAGAVFVLAGAAASVSLWLPWAAGDDVTGATLVRRGLEAPGLDALLRGADWPPVAVMGSGTALLLVGLLLVRRARTHRPAGVMALLLATPAAAGVLVRYAEAGWDAGRFGPGLWCAVAVAGLGLIGALKAMLALPRISVEEV